MIDIIQIYQQYNIKYWTEGKNVQKGWVNIQCPFCDDKTNHLGFELNKQYFYCWKCKHKFNDQVFKALKIPLSELNKHSIFQTQIREKLNEKQTFILPGKEGLNKQAKQYLIKRGYDPDYLIEKYKLRYCDHLSLSYNFRIVIPIFFEQKIISYTTRDYTDKQELRYISCPKEMEIIHHKHILYNIDNCKNNFIFVFEGNFNVWKMGDNCCSTFGTSYTTQQINLLKVYEIIIIIFDNEETAQNQAENLGNILSGLGKLVYIICIPKIYNDIAEIPEHKALIFKTKILNKLGLKE
jgi:DNA primase